MSVHYLRLRDLLRCTAIGGILLVGLLYSVSSGLAEETYCTDYTDQTCACPTDSDGCPTGSGAPSPLGFCPSPLGACPGDKLTICCSTKNICEGACYLGTTCSDTTEPAAGKCKKTQVCCKEKTSTAPGTKSATSSSTAVTQGSTTVLEDPLRGAGISAILGRLISTFLGLAGSLALLAFVWAGVIYMTAGDSDRIKQAQTIMKSTALGLLILIFAYTISKLFFEVLVK